MCPAVGGDTRGRIPLCGILLRGQGRAVGCSFAGTASPVSPGRLTHAAFLELVRAALRAQRLDCRGALRAPARPPRLADRRAVVAEVVRRGALRRGQAVQLAVVPGRLHGCPRPAQRVPDLSERAAKGVCLAAGRVPRLPQQPVAAPLLDHGRVRRRVGERRGNRAPRVARLRRALDRLPRDPRDRRHAPQDERGATGAPPR